MQPKNKENIQSIWHNKDNSQKLALQKHYKNIEIRLGIFNFIYENYNFQITNTFGESVYHW